MRSTWGPPGSCRPQMGPMMAPWTLLSGLVLTWRNFYCANYCRILPNNLVHGSHWVLLWFRNGCSYSQSQQTVQKSCAYFMVYTAFQAIWVYRVCSLARWSTALNNAPTLLCNHFSPTAARHPWGPLNYNGLTLIPAWISDCIQL